MLNQEEYRDQVALFQWALLESRKRPELQMLFASMGGVRLTLRQAVRAKAAGNN